MLHPSFVVKPKELKTVQDVHQALSRGPEIRFIHGSDFVKSPEKIFPQIDKVIADIQRLAEISAALSLNGKGIKDLYFAPIDQETAARIAAVIDAITNATEEQIMAALPVLNESTPQSPAKSKRK